MTVVTAARQQTQAMFANELYQSSSLNLDDQRGRRRRCRGMT
jgi:hypothetical protein